MKTKVLKLLSFIVLVLLIAYYNGYSNNLYKEGYIELLGNTKQAKERKNETCKTLDSVKFSVYNETQVIVGEYYSGEQGLFLFKVPINCVFDIKVSKEGWVTKVIKVDTRVPKGKLKCYYLPFEIEMFKSIPELELSVLNEPIAIVSFNPDFNLFDYNVAHTNEINEKLKRNYMNYFKQMAKHKYVISDTILTSSNNIHQQEKSNIPGNSFAAEKKEQNALGNIGPNENFVYKYEKSIDSVSVINNVFYKKPGNAEKKIYNIVFKIQILSLCCHLPCEAKVFDRCEEVEEYIHNDEYKYTVGEFKTIEEAQTAIVKVLKDGYSDAFIVAFVNGNRVPVDYVLLCFSVCNYQ